MSFPSKNPTATRQEWWGGTRAGYAGVALIERLGAKARDDCRIHLHSDKRAQRRRFLAPETFPGGTVSRSHRTNRRRKFDTDFCLPSETEQLIVGALYDSTPDFT